MSRFHFSFRTIISICVVISIIAVAGGYAYAKTHPMFGKKYVAHGLIVSYPSGWQPKVETVRYTAELSEPGLTLVSPDKGIVLVFWRGFSGPQFTSEQLRSIDVVPSTGSSEQWQIVSRTPTKRLPGVSAVQLVSHTSVSGGANASIYDAVELLLDDATYSQLGLQVGNQVTIDNDASPGIRLTDSNTVYKLGYNTTGMQHSTAEAERVFATPEAKIAHQILMNVRPSEPK